MNSKNSIFIVAVLLTASILPVAAQTGKKISGIGAGLMRQGNDTLIRRLTPGGSAQKAALPVGAKIVSVDGKSITGMSVEDVVKLINGQAGSVVSLTVIDKQSVSRTYSLVRMEMTLMTLDDVPGTYVDPNNPAMVVAIERITPNQFKVSSATQHWSGIGLSAAGYFAPPTSSSASTSPSAPPVGASVRPPPVPPVARESQGTSVAFPSNSDSIRGATSTGSPGAASDQSFHYIKGVYLMTHASDVPQGLGEQSAYFRIDLDFNNHLIFRTRVNFANDSRTTPELIMTEHVLKKK